MATRSESFDYSPLSGRKAAGEEPSSLKPPRRREQEGEPKPTSTEPAPIPDTVSEPTLSGETVIRRRRRSKKKDTTMLKNDRWLVRSGHFATYIALYLFTFMVFFRPYEIVPGLEFLASTAIYFAIATLVLYVPSQIATEGNLTMLSTEVKAVLALTALSLVTMPIARDPAMAWKTFDEPFIKAVVIFIVLVNVVRTRARLMGLIWLSLGIGVYLASETIRMYMAGEFAIEGYRVAVSHVKGIFGNPNDMAIHFVVMLPILITLGIASRSFAMRLVYWSMTGLFLAATLFTFSRGGFLGLMAVGATLAWKLGRRSRVKVSVASIVVGIVFMILAPGNYGIRLLSIFIPSLDPVGSAGARREGLLTSIIVTIRNPWGIGIGNSPTFGAHNLQTHNAYTQVSSELGILGLIAYLIFIVSPLRKLGAIERSNYAADKYDWFYYLAIGLQASIVGYMVSSFFASVAYNWFIYYLIAYAVAFRRIYAVEHGLTDADVKADPLWNRQAVSET